MDKNQTEAEIMLSAAREAMKHAYAPYSHFSVGACLKTAEGKLYTGCNIENASYGATNCAERTAVFKAVSEGERRFTAIAVAASNGGPAYPCGMCRQVLSEFASPGMKIYLSDTDGSILEYTLGELLPNSFSQENMI